jgi:hypothetical protein
VSGLRWVSGGSEGKTGLWLLGEALGAGGEAWGAMVWHDDGKRRKLGWRRGKFAIRAPGRAFYRSRSTHSWGGLSLSLGGVELDRESKD